MLYTTSVPFLQKPFIPPALRNSILTLLGPRPDMTAVPGHGRIGCMQNIPVQQLALLAYRAKIVALITVLEVGVKAAGN